MVSRRFCWCLSRILPHGRLSLILERPESRPFEDQVEHHWHHLFSSSSFPLYSNPRPPINTTLYESIPLHKTHIPPIEQRSNLRTQPTYRISPTALNIEPSLTIYTSHTHSCAILFFRAERLPATTHLRSRPPREDHDKRFSLHTEKMQPRIANPGSFSHPMRSLAEHISPDATPPLASSLTLLDPIRSPT